MRKAGAKDYLLLIHKQLLKVTGNMCQLSLEVFADDRRRSMVAQGKMISELGRKISYVKVPVVIILEEIGLREKSIEELLMVTEY